MYYNVHMYAYSTCTHIVYTHVHVHTYGTCTHIQYMYTHCIIYTFTHIIRVRVNEEQMFVNTHTNLKYSTHRLI